MNYKNHTLNNKIYYEFDLSDFQTTLSSKNTKILFDLLKKNFNIIM